MTSNTSSILSDRDTFVKYERGFLHGKFPNKNLFHFSQIHLQFFKGTPKDNDKNREINIWRISGKMASKVSLILPNHDTCVKYERGFCAWTCSKQKPLSFFTNSPLVVQKARSKDNDKNKKIQSIFRKFGQRHLIFLLQRLIHILKVIIFLLKLLVPSLQSLNLQL
jgi:hypothetical protein